MIRITGSSSKELSSPIPSEPEKNFSLDHLPENLPPPSHIHLSPADLAKLFLPDGVDISRIPSDHPIIESVRQLWLETTLEAVSTGGKVRKSSRT